MFVLFDIKVSWLGGNFRLIFLSIEWVFFFLVVFLLLIFLVFLIFGYVIVVFLNRMEFLGFDIGFLLD